MPSIFITSLLIFTHLALVRWLTRVWPSRQVDRVVKYTLRVIPNNTNHIVHYTVDGRNPAPVEVGSLSHYLQGFIHPFGGCLGFLNHQPYYFNYCSMTSTDVTWDTFQARSTCHVTLVSGEWQLPFVGSIKVYFMGRLALQLLHYHLNLDNSADSSSEKFQAGHL